MTDDQTLDLVYQYIRQYIAEHGYGPSLREIGKHCYLGNSSVLRCLDKLEGKGRIRRQSGRARAIQLIDDEHQ